MIALLCITLLRQNLLSAMKHDYCVSQAMIADVSFVWTCVSSYSHPLYFTARLMGPRVSIACVWTCVIMYVGLSLYRDNYSNGADKEVIFGMFKGPGPRYRKIHLQQTKLSTKTFI